MRKARAKAILGVLLASTMSAGASERLTMKMTPQVAYAPARVSVRTTIEADVDNRALEIVVDSDNFYRSSLIELNGDHAPRTSVIEFRDLPEGQYIVSATLLDQRGKPRGLARQMMNVLENAEPPFANR
jgi:hypothetical protein